MVSNGNTASVSTEGNSFSIAFVTPFLDPTDPGTGMLGGTTATITVPVVVPEDANYDDSGVDIVNTAQFAADNPDTEPVSDDHTVVIDVPLELATEVTKAFDPSDAVASNGAETTVTINASNESGTGVESLVVTEPDAAGADEVLFTPGEPGDTSATVEVVADAVETAAVTVTNHFEAYASLAVTKTVDPSVADADGNVPDFGPYVVIVECVYDAGGPYEHEVYADGYGPAMPMVAVLDNGETATFTSIPATSECTVTETYAGGASSTTMTVASADTDPVTVEGAVGETALTAGDTNTVEVLNVFDVGSLTIDKVVGGDGADEATGPYVFEVRCTLERDGLEPLVVWDNTVTLGGDQPMTVAIDGIADGSECVVTETDTGGADDTRLTPAGASDTEAVVTIAAGAAVTVTAYNMFDATDSGLLPITGFDGWMIAVIALVLLAVGAIIAIVARRRK